MERLQKAFRRFLKQMMIEMHESTEDQGRDKTQSPAGAGNAVFMI